MACVYCVRWNCPSLLAYWQNRRCAGRGRTLDTRERLSGIFFSLGARRVLSRPDNRIAAKVKNLFIVAQCKENLVECSGWNVGTCIVGGATTVPRLEEEGERFASMDRRVQECLIRHIKVPGPNSRVLLCSILMVAWYELSFVVVDVSGVNDLPVPSLENNIIVHGHGRG